MHLLRRRAFRRTHALEAMAREWESIASHGDVDMSEVPLISIIDDDSLASEGM